MTHDRSVFLDYSPFSSAINMGTSAKAYIAGIGSVFIHPVVDNKTLTFKLLNVLEIPSFRCQLLSVPKMAARGIFISFANSQFIFQSGTTTIDTGWLRGNLYIINSANSFPKNPRSVSENTTHSAHAVSFQLWHERLAHVNTADIYNLVNNKIVNRISLSSSAPPSYPCTACIYGKSHSLPFPTQSSNLSTNILQLIHTGVLGPINIPSLSSATYFISFTDDYSRWISIYPMHRKSDTL